MNNQLAIRFAPSFLTDFKTVGEFIADYSRPESGKTVKTVSADMDMGSSLLRSKLMGHDRNVFSVEDLRAYLKASGDALPLYFLLADALGDFDPEQLRTALNEFIERYEASR